MLRTVLMITAAALFAGGANVAFGQQQCLPGIGAALQGPQQATYTLLLNTLSPRVAGLRLALDAVSNQATYEVLLGLARNAAAAIPNGRLLVTLPDGTVVVDTSRPDDATNMLPVGNSYQHFIDKTVNENHNSRVAIFSAQQYPCGLGAESKLSTSTGQVETYIALRLGAHLDSSGTARLSVKQ
jgi:hypothetical protein